MFCAFDLMLCLILNTFDLVFLCFNYYFALIVLGLVRCWFAVFGFVC